MEGDASWFAFPCSIGNFFHVEGTFELESSTAKEAEGWMCPPSPLSLLWIPVCKEQGDS